MSAAGQVCARCQRVIRSGGQKFIPHSGSGARPTVWSHDIRDPSCRPRATSDDE